MFIFILVFSLNIVFCVYIGIENVLKHYFFVGKFSELNTYDWWIISTLEWNIPQAYSYNED